jgi:small subunit ribosomal protein S20
MPIKKNARKYMRVTAKKTVRNKIVKGVAKNAIKKTREAVAAGKLDDAKKYYLEAQKALDKAAEKNIVKKNTAARKKSRLNALIKKAVISPKPVKAPKKSKTTPKAE